MNLSGKRAVVFGGTSGIGLATTHALVDRGAEVHAISRNPDLTDADLCGSVVLHACDVCEETAVQRVFDHIGRFDMLISSATGGTRALGPFADMDMGAYQASFAKLWGYTNVVRHGLSYLADDGVIVLVSGSPARKCNPGQIALASVGGAVEAFVRNVAKEIAPIRINALCPGIIDTPIVQKTDADREEHFTRLTAKNLIQRAGHAEECAHGIIFLLENAFVTGSVVDVDGGVFAA